MGNRGERLMKLLINAAFVTSCVVMFTATAAAREITGRVLTSGGSGVEGATVRVAGSPIRVVTADDGSFSLPLQPPVRVAITAPGFAPLEVELTAPGPHELVVSDRRYAEKVTVTAAPRPTRLDETAASVAVISRDDLEMTAAAALDDALRQVPGFTLFRRAGSRTANPTAQGVSLRGVGASGASRSLVLDQGIPLNDPFGGWVYWGRVPRESIERVEVLRGGASDIYGSGALSGVIQVLRRTPEHDHLSARLSGGDADTWEGSLWLSRGSERWRGSLAAEGFATGGYIPVSPEERGSVDVPAASERYAIDLLGERSFDRGRLFGKLSWFDESRENGTRLQTNETALLHGSAGADVSRGNLHLEVRGYASEQEYDQTFSAVGAGRNSERLVRVQHVPASSRGGTLRASLPVGARSLIAAGADILRVEGVSEEVNPNFPASASRNGGTQSIVGLWIHDTLQLSPRTVATLAVRGDFWTNRQTAGGDGRRSDEAISPRLSVVHNVSDAWTLSGSAYRSFRAPTLNELYRGFRVGNVVTQPNGELGAERLTGVELGALYRPRADLRIRAVLYDMRVDDPVANVTLSVSPELIQRQRQNLGATRTRGLELDLERRMRDWSFGAGLLIAEPRVIDDGGVEDLEGRAVPQIPEHQVTGHFAWAPAGRWNVGLQARWTGRQYEDDRNTMVLGDYALVDAFASYQLTAVSSLFVAAENLFDEEYEIGRTPVVTLGQPRTVRAGLRIELP